MKMDNVSIKKKAKKCIPLRTSQTSSHKEEFENENEYENDNEDVALSAKRFFNQFKKKKSKFYNKDESFAKYKNRASFSSKNQSRNVECYNCHEIGHISTKCPMERKSKKKTLVATWDDSSKSKSDSDKSDQDETKS